jgi:hypothetical protein
MKLIAICLAVLSLACTVSPVIADPSDSDDDRYSACRRAASDYCRDVAGGGDEGQRACVSKATYDCVSRSASP